MELEQGVRLVILVAVFLLTTISNASVGVLMYRFKNLRSVPNLFILSSCIADILYQMFNIPGFTVSYVAKDDKFYVGARQALALSTFTLFFLLVDLLSMILMMIDRLCALKYDMAYRVWRTRSKAFMAIAAKWIVSAIISMVLLVLIWDVDLGRAPINRYRLAHFSTKRGIATTVLLPIFIIFNVGVAVRTCRVIKRQNEIHAKKMGLNQSTLSHARKVNEIKAMKTIGVTVLVFFLCYLPAAVYGVILRMKVITTDGSSWLGFTAYSNNNNNNNNNNSCLFIPGLLNPFIYAIRKRRFRKALKSFLKDPCGRSEITL